MCFYTFLADVIVVFHFAYAAFVVGGMLVILTGILLRWQWVRNFWFRTVHLLMIAVVVVESLCGVFCPLTDWENQLRVAGGGQIETGLFLARWIEDLLFINLSFSAMTVCYVVFGLAVLLTFIMVPPRLPWKKA